jgi:hypothetical protein
MNEKITSTTDGSLFCKQCERTLTWSAHDCESEECCYAFCPKCLVKTSSDCEDWKVPDLSLMV